MGGGGGKYTFSVAGEQDFSTTRIHLQLPLLKSLESHHL